MAAAGGASAGTSGTSADAGRDAALTTDADAAIDAAVDATVATDAPEIDGGTAPGWRDVSPVRNRVGPQTLPRQLFASEVQLGAYWETPSGDVLTSFRTSITQPTPGVAIYDYNYTMQTVVGGAILPVPDLAIAICRYQDLGSCSVGPDPDGPSLLSLVTDDGKILVARNKLDGASMAHPIVEQLDATTGALSPLVELSDMQMSAKTYTPILNLRRLGDGTVALAMGLPGTNGAAQTAVFDTTGARVGLRAGFAFGDRWRRFAVFLGQTSGAYNQRFDWWDPRTDASAFGFGFPAASPTPSFRTFVTPVGDVIFPGFTYTDRIVHIDESGSVVEDRGLPSWGFLGAMPDGRYFAYEPDVTQDGGLNYVVRIYDRKGTGTVIYDDPTIMRDAKWPALGDGRSYPMFLKLDTAALIDDAGNAYVDFVLQTGGDTTTETYLVAFAPDGHKLWGLNLKSWSNGICHTRQVLSNHRLIVSCSGRYGRRFLILGE